MATVESLKKTLLRTPQSRTSTTTVAEQLSTSRKALRFQELVGRIRRKGHITQRGAVFHLLKQLYNTGSPHHQRATRAAAVAIHADRRDSQSGGGGGGGGDNDVANAVVDMDNMIYGAQGLPGGGDASGGGSSRATHRKRTLVEPTRFQLEENMTSDVSEQYLIRDVIYTFQGIDGTYVKYSERARGYVVVPTAGVPGSVRSMVGKLCEMGWLFRKITSFINATTSSTARKEEQGLVGQSLCYALQEEMNDYYRLVAVLEAQMNEQIDALEEQRAADNVARFKQGRGAALGGVPGGVPGGVGGGGGVGVVFVGRLPPLLLRRRRR